MGYIDIPAILIANVMGIAILFVVGISNAWRIKANSKEDRYLTVMFIASFVNCACDPICFIADGVPGTMCRILVILCNTLLYLGGAVISFAWIYLVANHLNVKIRGFAKTVLYILFFTVAILLVVNLFKPVLFSVDKFNVYSREFGYWIYTCCYALFVLFGLGLYVWQWKSSGGLKFFPVWAYIIPATLGIVIQAVFYGVSTATPFITVSIACVILCLQNEFMQRDKLTGCYNRFYLNTVEKKLIRYPKLKYTMIMLDINGFKKINDNFGHKTGDEALIKLAGVLTEAVGKLGEVVRYAGDEFIIVINTQDEEKLDKMTEKVQELLDKHNEESNDPYKLSIAYGYCNIDLKEKTMDEYMDTIDQLMYENKQKYYQTHPKYDRRKS